jgi:hypothetical protein
MNSPDQFLQTAIEYYNRRNLPQAEALSRYLISIGEELPEAYNLLGLISLSISLPTYAVSYFKKALAAKSSHRAAKKNLKLALKEVKKQKNRTQSKYQFLLIKAWGSGFWADIDHVLGQLLLAEMTGRKPIVYWGKHSLYHDDNCENTFELYYEPVSDVTLEPLMADTVSYFPPKWAQYNLLYSDNNKWDGDYSRMAGLYCLNRDEDVIVSDFHTYVNDLAPWINERSPLSKMDAETIYRYLFKKYLKLKPDIQEEINQYWAEHIKNRPVLAVHIRGSDKIIESQELKEINAQYGNHIDQYLADRPEMMIFLLTDSTVILEEYREKYKDKLLHRDCARTNSSVGIHYQKHDNKRRVGIDVITDTYLASMCDAFIGYGGTNVSTTILHLKNWKKDDYTLLGKNALYQPHLLLHG